VWAGDGGVGGTKKEHRCLIFFKKVLPIYLYPDSQEIRPQIVFSQEIRPQFGFLLIVYFLPIYLYAD
jgi:hypothetical protein